MGGSEQEVEGREDEGEEGEEEEDIKVGRNYHSSRLFSAGIFGEVSRMRKYEWRSLSLMSYITVTQLLLFDCT